MGTVGHRERNLVGIRDAESDALALVRELVAAGWPLDALSLLAEDALLPVEALPPTVSGADLARRAGIDGPARRTA